MNQKHLSFTKKLNAFYKEYRALWELDHSPEGLTILDADNAEESVLYFMRHGKNPRDFLIVLCNFVPVERHGVKVGVPFKGQYEEIWNTEWQELGGTWSESQGVVKTTQEAVHNQEHAIEVILPALSISVFKPKRVYGVPKK